MKLWLKRANGGTGSNPAAEEGNEDDPEAQKAGWEIESVAESLQGSRMIQQNKQAGRHRQSGSQENNGRTRKKKNNNTRSGN